jgi:hypothetical protein
MDSSELARSRVLEDENCRMRRIISNLTLENDAINTLIQKNPEALAAKRCREGIVSPGN